MRPGRQNKRIPHRQAFTLVELLISVTLMSGILAAAYVCLQAVLTSRALIENRSDVVQTARVVMNLITADLRSAHRLSEQHTLLGLDRQVEGIEADNIDFVTRHYRPNTPIEADYCETSYFVTKNPETGRFALLRRRDPLPDDEPIDGGKRELLIEDILGLRFEYYDGWDWYDDWGDAMTPEETSQSETASLLSAAGRTGFPEAVRVSLLLPEKPNTNPPMPTEAVSSDSTLAPTPPPGALVFQTIVRLNLTEAELEGGGNESGNASQSPSSNTGRR